MGNCGHDHLRPVNQSPVVSTPLGTSLSATAKGQSFQASQLFTAIDLHSSREAAIFRGALKERSEYQRSSDIAACYPSLENKQHATVAQSLVPGNELGFCGFHGG